MSPESQRLFGQGFSSGLAMGLFLVILLYQFGGIPGAR